MFGTKTKLNKVREQRQLCNDIIAGFLHDGLIVSDIEHAFVRKCQKAMRPLDPTFLTVLEKIKKRHEK